MSNEIEKPSNRPMKKVRIDASLLEQIDWYDLFPKGMWSRQAKVNYLVQIGLGVLLLRFERECKERQPGDEKADYVDKFLRHEAISRLIGQAMETRIPQSELARLVSRSLYEQPYPPKHCNHSGPDW